MDTSETYIKMCEKAKEIQSSNRILGTGDVYFDKNATEVKYHEGWAYSEGAEDFDKTDGITVIWLPHQD